MCEPQIIRVFVLQPFLFSWSCAARSPVHCGVPDTMKPFEESLLINRLFLDFMCHM